MRIRVSALLAALLFCLGGCGDPSAENPPLSPASLPAQTDALPHASTESDAGALSSGETDGTVISVIRPDLTVCIEPGYDFAGTGILLDPGEYVITEETVDYEGIRWGKLESGDGWIDLDKAAEKARILLTAETASERTIGGDECWEYALSQSEYAAKLLLRAYETLTDFRVTAMDFAEDGLFLGKELLSLPSLTPQKPLVLTVAFPGDRTTYGIVYTDESGTEHSCILYQSGRSGAVILEEREP